LIPIIAKVAFKFNVLDFPDGRIKRHKKPVPYLGGITIFLPFIATLSLAFPFENKILWLLLGVILLLSVGLVDDLKVLRPMQKLCGQILAVLCFLKGGFSLKLHFFESSFINMFFSGFWMLSLINAFNLIDIMDGLASVVAIVATLSLFIISILLKQYAVSLLLISFVGPLFAFLFYNRPPAKIYLGDSGALYIGGFLAALPLLINWSQQSANAYYAPLIILAIPIMEVCCLVVIRSYKRIPFYRGSPHHFAIYLQKKGWRKETILLFVTIMGTALSSIAMSFLLDKINVIQLFVSLMILGLIWCFFVFFGKEKDIDSEAQNQKSSVTPARVYGGESPKISYVAKSEKSRKN
jgi:UDP-GlcNAc:undecaprenyl-phosphate GlcNAc-1-phosphate transferase